MAKKYSIKRDETKLYRIDYERELDAQQFEVVTAPNGPALVIAAAGSGKTRAITYRVARLVESGVSPDKILLVTFTNKAAREMLQRVDRLLRIDVKQICGGTFHSVGNRVMRKHAELIGFKPNFNILDGEDARDLIDSAVEESGVSLTDKRFPKTNVLQEIFSLGVNKRLCIHELMATQFPRLSPLLEPIAKVAEIYTKRKQLANVMDYDDLLVNWCRLLKESEEARTYWSRQFEQILVDEYQDTNALQSEIVEMLASAHRNIMVVGDDAQSIYGFRGANFENIFGFSDRFPDTKVYRLENNYRSRPEILALANASINKNKRQFPKNLQAVRSSVGEKPALVPLKDAEQQSQFVASRILELRDGGVPLSEIAVLYRSHWNSLELQLELTRRDIPYVIRSGMRFFEQAHIKDVVAYLKILSNPGDEAAWRRVLKQIEGIGRQTSNRIWDLLSASSDPLGVAQNPNFPIKIRAVDSWKAFQGLLRELSLAQNISSPGTQIEIVLQSGYRDFLLQNFDNALARSEDIEQMAKYAARFESSKEFLSDLALISSEGFGQPEGPAGEDLIDQEREDEKLILSTIHQAKGLEWKHVFLLWAAEGKFPTMRSIQEDSGEEEERRLFYVAVTRAKDELYLCYPMMENDYSRLTVVQRPSRFISEVPPELMEEWEID